MIRTKQCTPFVTSLHCHWLFYQIWNCDCHWSGEVTCCLLPYCKKIKLSGTKSSSIFKLLRKNRGDHLQTTLCFFAKSNGLQAHVILNWAERFNKSWLPNINFLNQLILIHIPANIPQSSVRYEAASFASDISATFVYNIRKFKSWSNAPHVVPNFSIQRDPIETPERTNSVPKQP